MIPEIWIVKRGCLMRRISGGGADRSPDENAWLAEACMTCSIYRCEVGEYSRQSIFGRTGAKCGLVLRKNVHMYSE